MFTLMLPTGRVAQVKIFHHEAPEVRKREIKKRRCTAVRISVDGLTLLGLACCSPRDNFNKEKGRKTALTVYHPLAEERRKELLVEPLVLEMADAVAETLERHFPGTLAKIAEIRVYRRGHPMCVSAPGRMALVGRASRPFGPVLFANTDCSASVSSFDGALVAARRAAEQARALLKV